MTEPRADDVSAYDYTLPEDRIAQRPLADRDASRLMVVDRATGAITHARIAELPTFLQPNDCLVFNDTRVVPARLFGERKSTGGKWEGLFLGRDADGLWELIGQTRGKLTVGERLVIRPADDDSGGDDSTGDEALELELVERIDGGRWRAVPDADGEALALLERFGTLPLPHYVGRDRGDAVDRERYQTIYARNPGAVAAPTAGLHFTPELLQRCRAASVRTAMVTLHVGLGTFRPIGVDDLAQHDMHSEWCAIGDDAAAEIARCRAAGGRVVAIGTTTVRTLESAAGLADGFPCAWSGDTSLFIRPPYDFRTVDVLLTNFHLPKSTLVVLVSAFAGREHVLNAYETAVREGYRFYSYGDAMLLV